jgi:hypothetical protein
MGAYRRALIDRETHTSFDWLARGIGKLHRHALAVSRSWRVEPQVTSLEIASLQHRF